MEALKRIPWKYRRAVARKWGARGNETQRWQRIEAGPTWGDIVWRAKQDARGQVMRHGVTYSVLYPEGRPWTILRSKQGRTNQVDLHVGTVLAYTGSLRSIEWGMGRAKQASPRSEQTHIHPKSE